MEELPKPPMNMSSDSARERQKPVLSWAESSNPTPEKSLREKFAEETSFHGVAYWLGGSVSWHIRALYFLFWLGMLALAGFFVWRNLHAYLLYETKISMRRDREGSLLFPAVTICPESNFKQSVVGGSPLMLDTISKIGEDRNAKRCRDETLKDMAPTLEDFNYFWKDTGGNKGLSMIMMKFEDLILNCSFRMQSIPCRELFLGHLTTMGKCYTFNHGLNPQGNSFNMIWNLAEKRMQNVIVHGSGPSNRLSLRLNVNVKETCETGVTDSVGFRMLLGDQTILPVFPDNSVLLEPGKRIQVAVEKIQMDQSKTENLGRCVSKKTLFLFNETDLYTRDNCVVQCLTVEIYLACDCIFIFFPGNGNMAQELLNNNIRPSNYIYANSCIGGTKHDCQNDIFFKFRKGEAIQHCYEDCPVECKRTDYNLQVSTASFPPKKMEGEVMEQTGYWTLADLKENVLEVDVFFRTLDVVTIEEDWAMTPTDLFSNIGGNFGLFLGASIFSFLELLRFLFWLRCKCGGRKE